ncbi:Mitochondrial ATPase complex subunit ATP10-like protein [Cladobotryum mycophilum]|uniref:Mitochondrial ATPase complex subunit ATP10-like protein n=1 Tax=Cladobotryum mycophilum TaxID=491253 RepID=A0ABR0SFA7_9HYPO
MASRRLELALTGLVSRRALTCSYCQWRRNLSSTAVRAATAQKPAAGSSMDPKSDITGTPIEAPEATASDSMANSRRNRCPGPLACRCRRKWARTRASMTGRCDSAEKTLTAKISRPYFRDWGNLRFQEGKSFIAPPRLFKAELSLFFPNLYGETLLKTDKEPRDTTPLLLGNASVVSIFSSQWAELQANSFISKEANPALHEVLQRSGDTAQLVRINYEDNAGKAWLVRMFMGSLRKKMGEKDWDKYYLVRRGITDEIRESIGLLNSKVGYTYLVDHHCRIRWAGSGPSLEEEKESLSKGLGRLVEEIKRDATLPAAAREKLPGKPHLEQPKI